MWAIGKGCYKNNMKRKGFICFILIILVSVSIIACSDPIGFPVPFRDRYGDDYSALLQNSAYPYKEVAGIQVIKQDISCGYACIEMLAAWKGKTHITEESVSEQNNGEISTSMGSGFLKEMTRQFPEWKITRYVNISNTELLKIIHASLDNGFPVPIEFAAKNTASEWTLHFGIVSAMDLMNNKIVVQNPYGYEESYSIQDFIRAVGYESYEDMEWYFKAGFTMGLFHKNTIYSIADV
jgi:hypothetical protein